MSKKTYGHRVCYVCGAYVSCSGAAYTAHMRKHVREGKVVETRDNKSFLAHFHRKGEGKL